MILKCAIILCLAYYTSAQIPDHGIRIIRPGRVVQLTTGLIQGNEETYGLFKTVHTFKGIRYAQPPVGNLRFKAPVPAQSWSGTINATNHGAKCPQIDDITHTYSGNEDCLFLNVYSPPRFVGLLPVVVNIHGGGFQWGSGNSDILGPEFFVEEGIIHVTLNYRLGVLGFLHTGDLNPSNNGLRDIILALRWVQDNIRAFGGNPNDVTIQGLSAGGAAVHALVLSEAANGLFHKAISQSGSMLHDWAFNPNPEKTFMQLGNSLRLQFSNRNQLFAILGAVSTESLIRGSNVATQLEPELGEFGGFVPTVESEDSTEIKILTNTPYNLMKNGKVSKVPYLIGYTSAESLPRKNLIENDNTLLERYRLNPNLLIPPEWNIAPNSQDAAIVINAFFTLYFDGMIGASPNYGVQFADYMSDREAIFASYRQSKNHASMQKVFTYRFSYSGAFNYVKRLNGLMHLPGAVHAEDDFYLLRLNKFIAPVRPNDEAFKIRTRHVRLFTNFIKYGDPTPAGFDPLIPVTWTPTKTDEFMNIGEFLVMQDSPSPDRISVWSTFDEKYRK